MWTKEELKLFKEFTENKVSSLNINHLKLIQESAKDFDWKLSFGNTKKLIELSIYLMEK